MLRQQTEWHRHFDYPMEISSFHFQNKIAEYHLFGRLFLQLFKVMLHGTIRNDGFQRNAALQRWNNVVTIRDNVATLL